MQSLLCPGSGLWKDSFWCGSVECGAGEKLLCVLVKAEALPWPKAGHWCFAVGLQERAHTMPRGWTIKELTLAGAGAKPPKVLAHPGRTDTHCILHAERLATAAIAACQLAVQHVPAHGDVKDRMIPFKSEPPHSE